MLRGSATLLRERSLIRVQIEVMLVLFDGPNLWRVSPDLFSFATKD